jgi:hypothetical protein
VAKYRHFKEHQGGQGEYVEMTGEWNEAHLAFYCVAVTITEVEHTLPTSPEWRKQ